MWLFGTLGAWNIVGSIAIIKLLIDNAQIKTMLSSTSEKYAKILHSPDDHHGLDILLDKYIDRNYELSLSEWEELKDRTDKIFKDKSVSKSERMLAAFINELCYHKTMFKQQQQSALNNEN